ncbi:TlyA family RNA methyltransferase [Ornithinimicrobium pekingense]|uniref:TlyA family rRNA (Cytidine-2'-O)-methyltransferase n=1 Tax=Ornithinimicrobium pekingense TaxID=384677 RepID=A0ABQ2F987_9MICO|nr:TlyA family RNA methyltransferase [Ornithinimicrobium pekingense]GGK73964.1 TlyA family rRNA (cytidine-2'-O)-methyltransferase [Ornithinimicrobium pekingense]
MTARLDAAMVARGLARSRTQAQALVRDGRVLLDGTMTTRSSSRVGEGQDIVVTPADEGSASAWITRGWVGRGAVKLHHALVTWRPMGLQVEGRRCLDVGASTGGFTQVLLEHGAVHAVALDVGHGQLDPSISTDARVTELSGTNVREVDTASVGGRVGVVVCDVSFISLRHVVPVLPALLEEDAEVVLLVKPQFEVGRAGLAADGVVRSAASREQALGVVVATARDHGLAVLGLERSPVTGETGNVEYLLWLRPVRPGMIGWGLAPEELALRCHDLSQEEDR